MRVAIYSQDGLGLGHLRRTSSIAEALLQARDDLTVLAMCDSPVDQLFGPATRYDRIKLPTVVKRSPGVWEAPLGEDVTAVLKLRAQLLRAALVTYLPDLLLVDHMPHGAMGELIDGLEALRLYKPEVRIVLGLRDIIDAPGVVRARWIAEGAYDVVERLYDRVLVYGSPDVYELADLYGFSAAVRSRTRYCGFVVSPAPSVDREIARQTLMPGLPTDRPLVVVMGGSGHDAAPMMACAAACADTGSSATGWATIIVCGPYMPVASRRELATHVAPAHGRVLASVDNSATVLAAADAVVSMAGYNTTMETLASGTPGVLIPRRGPSLEQRTRAMLFAQRGWVERVDPDELSSATLSAALHRALAHSSPLSNVAPPDLSGRDTAVHELLSLVGDARVALAAPA
jgi:predicted glycosyltransferase